MCCDMTDTNTLALINLYVDYGVTDANTLFS